MIVLTVEDIGVQQLGEQIFLNYRFSDLGRATKLWGRWSPATRTITIRPSALLARQSPPRLSRWWQPTLEVCASRGIPRGWRGCLDRGPEGGYGEGLWGAVSGTVGGRAEGAGDA
jgi:hypothetical protein